MVSEGKRMVLNSGFVCALGSFVLLFMAFSSPYWFQSWPRVYSPFKRIGLWEACFAGLILPMDPSQKAYHGCWWTLAKEYIPIREWLMPWWFIITQICITVALVIEVVNLILILVTWCVTSDMFNNRRAPIRNVRVHPILMAIVSVLKVGSLILFGVASWWDRYWMPFPDLNYLSWSYGLAIVSTFFSIFATIAFVPYWHIVRKELFEPPPPVRPMLGQSMSSSFGDSKI